MPRKVEYPTSSFSKSLDLANAVNDLGGECSSESAADHLGKKLSGGFNAIINSAIKYKLISNSRGQLSNTDLYKKIKLAYTQEEERENKIEGFLNPPTFSKLYDRFVGMKLPISTLDRILIREYDVEEKIASRLVKYFKDGLASLELLTSDGKVVSFSASSHERDQEDENIDLAKEETPITPDKKNESSAEIEKIESFTSEKEEDDYIVIIKGPGLNQQIIIKEEFDLEIVSLVLKKVEKKLAEKHDNK